MKTLSKKDEILDCAQILIQKRGYNGFSYADIAASVGIRKASIHHYFPTKEDLVVTVIERYRKDFNRRLQEINSKKTWMDKIQDYAELYKLVLDEDKLCLCGMLASDVEMLPKSAKKAIGAFFLDNVNWVTDVLQNISTKLSKERLHNLSWQIINMLQGAIITARILNEPEIFLSSYKEMMQQLKHLS